MTTSNCNLVCVKKIDDKVYRTIGTFNTNDMAILDFWFTLIEKISVEHTIKFYIA